MSYDRKNSINSKFQTAKLRFFESADQWAGLLQQYLNEEDLSYRHRIFTPFQTLWTFLTQVLSPDHSCRGALSQFLAMQSVKGEKVCSSATGAYCRARQRLPENLLKSIVRRLGHYLEKTKLHQWKWKERNVYIVDGCMVSMPDTASNRKAFAGKYRKTGLEFPFVKMVGIISLSCGALLDLAMGPSRGRKGAETFLFRSIQGSLSQGDLLLFDRGFVGFFDLAAILKQGIDFVTRPRSNFKNYQIVRELSPTCRVICLQRPPRYDFRWLEEEEAEYENFPKEIRLREQEVEVKQSGFRTRHYRLWSSLMDVDLYSENDLSELYRMRWNIELDIRSIKTILQMDILRCKSAAMIRKEIWMHFMAYNLIRMMMADAAEISESAPREISFKTAHQMMLAYRPFMMTASQKLSEDLYLCLLKSIGKNRVGQRPNRVEPRAIRRRPKECYVLQKRRSQYKRVLKYAA